jgi:hypothetical protein
MWPNRTSNWKYIHTFYNWTEGAPPLFGQDITSLVSKTSSLTHLLNKFSPCGLLNFLKVWHHRQGRRHHEGMTSSWRYDVIMEVWRHHEGMPSSSGMTCHQGMTLSSRYDVIIKVWRHHQGMKSSYDVIIKVWRHCQGMTSLSRWRYAEKTKYSPQKIEILQSFSRVGNFKFSRVGFNETSKI